MFDLILIRFGELSLKGKNKMYFINQLSNNISSTCSIKKDDMFISIDRIFIPYSKTNLEKLSFIFGISSYSPVFTIKTSLKNIENIVLDKIPQNSKTFKVNSRRS